MMKKFWSHSLYAATAAALAVGGTTACGLFDSGKIGSHDVTYEVSSSNSGSRAKVIYLKKIPPSGATVDATNGDQYVGVQVVDLPWKQQVALDGSVGNAYVGVALDPSSVKIDPTNPSASEAALSATFTCTITADNKQIDHQDSKAGAFCAGPDSKDKLKNLGKH